MRKKLLFAVREKTIEDYFCKQVQKAGGLAPKIVVQQDRGWPDRKALVPPGLEYWVELKKPKGGVIGPKQKIIHRRLRAIGIQVYVLYTKQQVDEFIKMIKNDIKFL